MCLCLLFVCLDGPDFTTLLGRSLHHSLVFERFQILASGPFNRFSSDGCLPDSGGGATRDAI